VVPDILRVLKTCETSGITCPTSQPHVPENLDPEAILVVGKVKFSLEQATKAQRGSRGIALLFL
jgi:hypothetical protein